MRFPFDFNNGDGSWEPGFAGYDASDPAKYQLAKGFKPRPRSCGKGKTLWISGVNHSGGLFMYWKRPFGGLTPNAFYEATATVEFASQYAQTVSAAGSPGKAIHLKLCGAGSEPVLVPGAGVSCLDIDIGKAAAPGANSVVLGDIQRPPGQGYALVTRKTTNPLRVKTSEEGALWMLFGADSCFKGPAELYYTAFELHLDALP